MFDSNTKRAVVCFHKYSDKQLKVHQIQSTRIKPIAKVSDNNNSTAQEKEKRSTNQNQRHQIRESNRTKHTADKVMIQS